MPLANRRLMHATRQEEAQKHLGKALMHPGKASREAQILMHAHAPQCHTFMHAPRYNLFRSVRALMRELQSITNVRRASIVSESEESVSSGEQASVSFNQCEPYGLRASGSTVMV